MGGTISAPGGAGYDLQGHPVTLRSSASGLSTMLPLGYNPAGIPGIYQPLVVLAGFPGATVTAGTAGSGVTTYNVVLQRNFIGLTVGTVTFQSGATTGTITWSPPASLILPSNTANPAFAGGLLVVYGDFFSMNLVGTAASGFSNPVVMVPVTFI